MCNNSDVGFVNAASDGLTIKYTESKNTHWLSKIKECKEIAYFEMQFNVLEDVDVLQR